MRFAANSIIVVILCFIQTSCSSRITVSDYTNISDSNKEPSINLVWPKIETIPIQTEKNIINEDDQNDEDIPDNFRDSCRIKYHK